MEVSLRADLDSLATALYVRITDAELITVAVLQALLGFQDERGGSGTRARR